MLQYLRQIVPNHLPVVTYPDKTNGDLMARVNSFVQDSVNQTAAIAVHFKGANAAKNVFDFLKQEIVYKADGFNQDILKPNALIIKGVGDCKSFTLFAAGVLINLGYNVVIRYAGYNNNTMLNHVYLVANGIIVDPVWGIYNSEKPYKVKRDFQINKKWK